MCKGFSSWCLHLGTAMAALGGIGAAPFIPVKPEMGDAFQMQGFITVVIGGMGSYVGAFIGALLLGMAARVW